MRVCVQSQITPSCRTCVHSISTFWMSSLLTSVPIEISAASFISFSTCEAKQPSIALQWSAKQGERYSPPLQESPKSRSTCTTCVRPSSGLFLRTSYYQGQSCPILESATHTTPLVASHTCSAPCRGHQGDRLPVDIVWVNDREDTQ